MRNRLTLKIIAGELKPGRYPDGGGLYLKVGDTGSRSWVYRYSKKQNGRVREHFMGLGSLNDVTLAQARSRAEELRRGRLAGVDPILARTEAAIATARGGRNERTFRECAEGYMSSNRVVWRNAKHRAQWVSTLERYVYPVIGDMHVNDIETRHVVAVLLPIWSKKPETAGRVRGRIEAVLARASKKAGQDEVRAKIAEDRAQENARAVEKVSEAAEIVARRDPGVGKRKLRDGTF